MSNPDIHTEPKVSPLAKFRGITEDGRIVESTAPLPNDPAEGFKYYFNTVPNASIHRTDGKRCAFGVKQIFKTNIKADQEFLDKEIALGHPNITMATADQIEAFKVWENPKQAYREQLEPQLRAELEVQIRAELEAKLGLSPGNSNSDPAPNNLDADKIAGTSAVQQALAKLKEGKGDPSTVAGQSGKIVMDTPVSRLGGIVTTSQVKDISGASNSK